MRIYVASSWRNQYQPEVVKGLKERGHSVYDFRHPEPGNDGFQWDAIDPGWRSWTPRQYAAALKHVHARKGFALDINALHRAEATILILPAGRSASLELGIAIGRSQLTAVFVPPDYGEPDLMYAAADELITKEDEIYRWAGDTQARLHGPFTDSNPSPL